MQQIRLLTIGVLGVLLLSCTTLKEKEKQDETKVKYVTIDNIDYGCVDTETFKVILKEAYR